MQGCGFNSQSWCHQVVTTWMGDCLWTGKPSRYITNTKVHSAFHPSGVSKLSTGLFGWSKDGASSPVFTRWQVTLYDPTRQTTLSSFETGFPWKAVPFKPLKTRNAWLVSWSEQSLMSNSTHIGSFGNNQTTNQQSIWKQQKGKKHSKTKKTITQWSMYWPN